MKQNSCICLLACLLQVSYQYERIEDYYKATVVDYMRRDRTTENIENYKKYIHTASSNNVDIIVFPESTLISNPYIKSLVPHGSEKITPYKNETYNDYPPMKEMSKAAAEAKMYVVINLVEFANCTPEDECPWNGHFSYNTDVVFDREGTVIARYRKYNLFDEFHLNRPDKPDLVTFETDFGVTFGIFTCFDLMFQTPAIDLFTKLNITNFIFPTYWFGELPFLTASQAQAGWSYSLNVNLLSAAGNFPQSGSTGSGFYHGRKGSFEFMTDTLGDHVITGYVPKFRPGIGDDFKSFNVTVNSFHTKNMEMKPLSDPSKKKMTSKALDKNSNNFTDHLCSDTFCCKFDIHYRKNPLPTEFWYEYRAIAYSGMRKFGISTTGTVDYCAVVLCVAGDCTKRPSKKVFPLIFDRIKIKGNFKTKNAFQMPDTLIQKKDEKYNVNLHTMDYDSFTYYENKMAAGDEKTVSMELNLQKVDNLMTFGIFGRQFNKDTSIHGAGSAVHVLLQMLLSAVL